MTFILGVVFATQSCQKETDLNLNNELSNERASQYEDECGKESVIFKGIEHSIIGDAHLFPLKSSLLVSNLGNDKENGVAIQFGHFENDFEWGITFQEGLNPSELPIGASKTKVFKGNDGSPLAQTKIVNTGKTLRLQGDFSNLGAKGATINLYRKEQLIEQIANYSGNGIDLKAVPRGTQEVYKYRRNGRLKSCTIVTYGTTNQVSTASLAGHIGELINFEGIDKIEVLPSYQDLTSEDAIQSVEIYTEDIPELIIIDEFLDEYDEVGLKNPANKNNPYDKAGQLHNTGLDFIIAREKPLVGLKDNKQALEQYIFEKATSFVDKNIEEETPLSLEELKQGAKTLFDVNQSTEEAINQAPLSSYEKEILYEFLHATSTFSQNNVADVNKQIAIAIKFENRIVQDKQIENQAILLSSISVLKHSTYYWAKQGLNPEADWNKIGPVSSINWWDVAKADFRGAFRGGVKGALISSAVEIVKQIWF